MPNIEIYGDIDFVSSAIMKIYKIFRKWECVKDMIITPVISKTTDLFGNPAPYLRVCDTNEEEGIRIAKQLRFMGYDVEFLKLDGFLAKPLYTLEEIKEELGRWFTGNDPIMLEFEKFNLVPAYSALSDLANMESDENSKLKLPLRAYENKNKKVKLSDSVGDKPEQKIARFTRWLQMREILSSL